MSSDAVRLEALGEPIAEFTWRGHHLSIPRAVEDWPLDLITAGRVVDAVLVLLDGQTAPIPRYGDACDLSDAMAAACGISRLPEAKSQPGVDHFGAVPLLLWLLDEHEDDVACDLRTLRGVDYRDRWRGDLTLREIWVMIRRVPPTSALAIARNGGRAPWTREAIVTAQVWEQLARQVYVGRPMTGEEIDAVLARKAEDDKKVADLKDREAHWSPAAARARKAAAAAESAAAPQGDGPALPPHVAAVIDKAVAARTREISHRKAM